MKLTALSDDALTSQLAAISLEGDRLTARLIEYLIDERVAAVPVGPALEQHLLESEVEQRRNAVPVEGTSPDDHVRRGGRQLYGAFFMSPRMRVVSSTHRSRARPSFHLSSCRCVRGSCGAARSSRQRKWFGDPIANEHSSPAAR